MNEAQMIYEENVRKGLSKKEAAKDAQKKTGLALRSGQKFNRNHRSLRQIGTVKRQYE